MDLELIYSKNPKREKISESKPVERERERERERIKMKIQELGLIFNLYIYIYKESAIPSKF